MHSKRKTTAGSIGNYLHRNSDSSIYWQLRFRPVCSSTEIDLTNWINNEPFSDRRPRAIFAASQKNGVGQRGKFWHSPQGGIWLSAALPVEVSNQSTSLFGLAIAYALCERLESRKIFTNIKWPNDLFFCDKKLVGFLPKLIFRGQIFRFARVGIGMNVLNRTPPNGISLREILGVENLSLSEWSAEVLIALERAIDIFKNEQCFFLEAEKRLIKKDIFDPDTRKVWQVDGLNQDGSLRLSSRGEKVSWNRWN